MILDYYNLREQPFGATPDSRYLFASNTHREALASLLYGVEAGRGFMAFIAKPGMGKTTLLFRGLSQLREGTKTVFIFQAIATPLDFLRTLLADLGVQELQGGLFELQAKLNSILLERARRGERLVVIVDETQNLDESVLEFVRMLSNFETPQEKLMQIILSGQPQLATKLALPGLVQLRQRISIIAHLEPFSPDETAQYVDHRLRVAGYDSDKPLFTPAAMRLIASYTEGIPRNINNLCFNALSLGCALKQRTIDVAIIREAITDLDLEPLAEVCGVMTNASSGPIAVPDRTVKSSFGTWMLKAVAATIAFIALSGLVIRGDSRTTFLADAAQHLSSRKLVPLLSPTVPASVGLQQVSSSAPAHSDVARGTPSSDEGVQPDPEAQILVPPGVSLYDICTQTLKSCHSRELDEIQRLNAWLTNLNHLESGRLLRIPSRNKVIATATTQGAINLTSSRP